MLSDMENARASYARVEKSSGEIDRGGYPDDTRAANGRHVLFENRREIRGYCFRNPCGLYRKDVARSLTIKTLMFDIPGISLRIREYPVKVRGFRGGGQDAEVREVCVVTADEADRLARENLWRCRTLARRLTRHRPQLEDEAESVALVGLADAVRAFAPDRGRRRPVDDQFGVFAHVVIGRYISNYLYRGEVPKGYRRRPGLPRPAAPGVVSASVLAAGPLGVDAAPPVGREAEWEDLVLALSRLLPGRRGELFRRHYLRARAGDPCGTWRATWAWAATTRTRSTARPWPCSGTTPRRGGCCTPEGGGRTMRPDESAIDLEPAIGPGLRPRPRRRRLCGLPGAVCDPAGPGGRRPAGDGRASPGPLQARPERG